MTSREGLTYVIETRCKTWSCLGCRDSAKNLLRMRIAYGCLTLGQCYFITLTLRLDPRSTEDVERSGGLSLYPMRDAAFVGKAWRALLSSLKRNPLWKEMAWLKVPELTARGQPHLHVILGGIGSWSAREVHCEQHPHSWGKAWRDRECSCLEHTVSRAWNIATGGSWIVDVRPVVGAYGAAAYLMKYVVKGMYVRGRLEELGFLRRWSRSANWPGGTELHLAGTDQGWVSVKWKGGEEDREASVRWAEVSAGAAVMEHIGTDLGMELAERNVRKGGADRIKKLMVSGADVKEV